MKNQNSPRVFLGLLFVIIGALLLLRITNIDLPFLLPDILFKWPMILVVLGVFFFFSRENKTTGLILFAIGAVFLLQIAFNISLRDIFNYAIPVLLVIVGLALILPRHRRKKKRFFKTEKNQTDNNLEAVDIFSGGSRVITSENFEGGELVCIFAGTEVYFKETVLAKGENVLEVTCIFGGCEISVPDDWTVRTDTTSIFSGTEDKRHKAASPITPDPEKILTIKGTLLFSGLEIKRI